MLIQKVNRTDAEAVYIPVMNINANTATLGFPVCFDWRATASLGHAVDQPTTSTLSCFAGVMAEDVAADAVGRVQIYGYAASAVVHVGGNSVSAGGLGIGPIDGSWSLQTTGYPSDGMNAINSAAPFAMIFENDLSGPGYAQVFVRAM